MSLLHLQISAKGKQRQTDLEIRGRDRGSKKTRPLTTTTKIDPSTTTAIDQSTPRNPHCTEPEPRETKPTSMKKTLVKPRKTKFKMKENINGTEIRGLPASALWKPPEPKRGERTVEAAGYGTPELYSSSYVTRYLWKIENFNFNKQFYFKVYYRPAISSQPHIHEWFNSK